ADKIAKVAGQDAAKRLALLTKLAENGDWIVPDAVKVQGPLIETVLDMAAPDTATPRAGMEAQRDRGLDVPLRVLRRQRRREVARKVEEALREGILKMHDRHADLGALNELLGFYVAEVGAPAPGDEFQKRLVAILEATAERFREKSPITRVFVLSLLADV